MCAVVVFEVERVIKIFGRSVVECEKQRKQKNHVEGGGRQQNQTQLPERSTKSGRDVGLTQGGVPFYMTAQKQRPLT